MCLDLWLSSARCACGGRLGGWGPRSYTSISDVGNAVYFARSPPPPKLKTRNQV